MFEWLVKKIIVGKINDLLKQYKGNVDKVRTTLKLWIERIKKVLGCFESLLAKLDDNQLDADEINQTTDEVSKLIKEW